MFDGGATECGAGRLPSAAARTHRAGGGAGGARLTNRIGSLLANQGIAGFKPLKKGAPRELDALRTGDGHELPPHLRTTIARILHRIELLAEQIKAAEAEREPAAAHGAGGGGGRCGGVPHRPI